MEAAKIKNQVKYTTEYLHWWIERDIGQLLLFI